MLACIRCSSLFEPIGNCHTAPTLCPQCAPLTNEQILLSLRSGSARTVRDVATDLNRSDAEVQRELERMRRAGFINRLDCGCCYALAGSDVEAA